MGISQKAIYSTAGIPDEGESHYGKAVRQAIKQNSVQYYQDHRNLELV